jgi:hypothetical protein
MTPWATVALKQGFGIGEGFVFTPLAQQRLGAKLLVEPQVRLLACQKRQQLVMTPRLQQAGQRERGRCDMNETLMVGPRGLDHIEIPLGMQVHQGRKGRDLPKAMRDRRKIINAVVLDRLAQLLKPLRASFLVGGRVYQDRQQLVQRAAHRGAKRTRGGVDMLESRPDALGQRDHPLGSRLWIDPRHSPDLGAGRFQTLDRLG